MSPRPPPAGVLLAAGAGTRFGAPKALARLGAETLVTRGVRMLAAGGCEPVVAVLGADAARVAAEADLAGADVVVNQDWEQGIGSSLRAGLGAVAGRAPAAVVALADQPLVTPEVVRRLCAAWRAGARVAIAAYDGVPRNPVLFDAAVWADVAASVEGDEGARGWLRAHPAHVTLVECGAVGAPDDVDTPEDLEWARRAAARSAPWPPAGPVC